MISSTLNNRSYRLCLALLLTVVGWAVGATSANGSPCIVFDAGGTAGLPPAGCVYTTPNDDLSIIDGLPPGTVIDIDSALHSFWAVAVGPGGSLGGETQNYQAMLDMPMVGHGTLAGFVRNIFMPLNFVESHSAPRVPGTTPQSFATDMHHLQGQIIGDPDFDLLRITAGTGFGLPSPGHTTLTRLGPPGSNWNVDSFFDITYRIDFIGAPGGPLGGMSGSTTGTIRFATGGAVPEPGMGLLSLSGIAGVVLRWRRRVG